MERRFVTLVLCTVQVPPSSLPCLSTSQIHSSERASQASLSVTDAAIVTAPKSQQQHTQEQLLSSQGDCVAPVVLSVCRGS